MTKDRQTPIYYQAFEAACDHAIETGQDDLLDDLEAMDADTRPGNPVLEQAAALAAQP